MSCNPNYKHLQLRRGNYWDFYRSNLILDEGEVSYAYQSSQEFYILKIGDGITKWRDLPCLKFKTTNPYKPPTEPCAEKDILILQDDFFDTSFYGHSIINSGVVNNSGDYTLGFSSYEFSGVNNAYMYTDYSSAGVLGSGNFRLTFDIKPSGTTTVINNSEASGYPLFHFGRTIDQPMGSGDFSIGIKNSGVYIYDHFNDNNLVSSDFYLPQSWSSLEIERINHSYNISINNSGILSNDTAFGVHYIGDQNDAKYVTVGAVVDSGNNISYYQGLMDNIIIKTLCPQSATTTTTTTTMAPGYYCVDLVNGYYCVEEM